MQHRPGSHLDGLVKVRPNASSLVASRCAGIIGPGFWQNATSPLPVSQFHTRFRSSTDVPDNTVQNQPGSDLVLANCVRNWPKRIRSGSNPVCKNHPARFWPMLPSRSGPDTSRIRHVYWAVYIKSNFLKFFFAQCTDNFDSVSCERNSYMVDGQTGSLHGVMLSTRF